MNWLRSHIIRIGTILLVGTGFGLFLTQSVYLSRKPDVLVNYLEQIAKLPETADVSRELEVLQQSSTNFQQIIEQAVRLINKNPGAFDASIIDLAVSNPLYQLLFKEWNALKADISMSGLLSLSLIHSFRSDLNSKANMLGLFGAAVNSLQIIDIMQSRSRVCVDTAFLPPFYYAFIRPMSSGVAIGAP